MLNIERKVATSFAVGVPIKGRTHVILGVTSIVPNMNGILFFVENGDHFQIESYQMGDHKGNMFISYEKPEWFEGCNYIIHDCRTK